MKRPALSPASILLFAGAIVLGLFLAVGWILPGKWSAHRTAVLQAPPSAVFPWVDSPTGWQKWTPWPDSGVVREGPERGVGAKLSWNDAELGDGSFEIVEAKPDSLIRYRVLVQEGAMYTNGTMRLSPEGSGTRVRWTEQGDFGGNPLMGYWARFMEHAQGAELEKALGRLGTMAEGIRAKSPAAAARPAALPR